MHCSTLEMFTSRSLRAPRKARTFSTETDGTPTRRAAAGKKTAHERSVARSSFKIEGCRCQRNFRKRISKLLNRMYGCPTLSPPVTVSCVSDTDFLLVLPVRAASCSAGTRTYKGRLPPSVLFSAPRPRRRPLEAILTSPLASSPWTDFN